MALNPAAPPSLRPATLADAATALAWTPELADLRRWAGPDIECFPTPDAFLQHINRSGNANYGLCTVAGELVAFGQIGHREQTYGHLARLVVAPAWRGRGLGRLLCRSLMREARHLHPTIRGFTLYVMPDNTPALTLYLSLGFVGQGIEPKYDCLLMLAPLSAGPAA